METWRRGDATFRTSASASVYQGEIKSDGDGDGRLAIPCTYFLAFLAILAIPLIEMA